MKHTKTTFLALTLTALFGAVALNVPAQDPPPPDFGENEDPFAEDSPFGSEDPFAGANPFADPGTSEPANDPFANTAASGDDDNPFAMGSIEGGSGNPFGGGETSAPAGNDNPFGGGGGADDNPFATGAIEGGSDNPFGGSPAPAEDDNPFGFGGAPQGTSTPSGRGITELYDFRFVEQANLQGETVIRRRMMTKEEARQFDEQWLSFFRNEAISGADPAYDATLSDPDAWAQWRYYADQLALWGIYCREFVLQGVETDVGFMNIVWPGDGFDPEAEEQEGESNIFNENRPLDDQLADFNPIPDTRQGRESQTVFSPEQMDAQATFLYNIYLDELRSFEESQVMYMKGLKNRLESRQQQRESYELWREDQRQQIMDLVDEWNRRYEGKVTMIEGVRYELYQPGNEPRSVTRGANVVVTDYDLTPYDILNNDGTLRGPAEQ